MLNDTARKILRMLDAHGYIPEINELARKAGRREWQVRAALRELADKDYIAYDPDNHFATKIIRAWETDLTGEERKRDPRLPNVDFQLWESF